MGSRIFDAPINPAPIKPTSATDQPSVTKTSPTKRPPYPKTDQTKAEPKAPTEKAKNQNVVAMKTSYSPT